MSGYLPIAIHIRSERGTEPGDFRPEGFRFAHRIARDPASLTDADVADMRKAFGIHRTAARIWYGGWCNYMTRVADTFQFPLERENCFMPAKTTPQSK